MKPWPATGGTAASPWSGRCLPRPRAGRSLPAIKGSTARITTDTYVEYPALTAEGADFASRVVAIATAFAWGNLDNIKPEESF